MIHKYIVAAYALGFFLLTGVSAKAATYTFNGQGADVFMSTPGNWVGGMAPASLSNNDIVVSAIPLEKQASIGVNFGGNASSFVFASDASAMNVFGTTTYNNIQFAANGTEKTIQNLSTATQTFGSIQVRQFWISGSNRRIWDAANGDLVFSWGPVLRGDSAGTAGKVWELTGSHNITFNGSISVSGFSNGASQVSMEKTGTGTLILKAESTSWAGDVKVNAGTLLVQNTSGSALGTGAVTVGSGANFGGSGAVSGSVTLNAGTLAAGDSVGTLETGSLALNNGSTLAMELDSGAALSSGADLVIVSGNLNLTGTVDLSLNDIAATSSAFDPGTTFSLVNYSGTWNGGLFSYDGSALAEGGQFSDGLNTWQIFYESTVGGANFSGEYIGSSSFVNLVAVPEPTVCGLMVASALLIAAGIRSRRRA